MVGIKEKLLTLGRAGKTEELSKLVQNQDMDGLVEMVRRSLTSIDGPAMFLYTLQGIGVEPDLEKNRLSLIKTTLQELIQNICIPSSTAKTITEEVESAIRNLGSESLSVLAELLIRCLEEVDTGGGGEEEKDLSWIQIFSTLFSEIKEKEFITPRDTLVEITGAEYRTRLISTLCDMRWTPCASISMCLMLQQAKLSTAELEEVWVKMNQCLQRSDIRDVAPLFHQLLKLVRTSSVCSGKLITSITQYFTSKMTLARRVEESQPTMDSMELIQTDYSAEEIQQTEGIIIYYIAQAAKMGHPAAKEIVKIARSASSFPVSLMNPFSLFNCLALTSVKQYSEAILDNLKLTISKGFTLEGSREASVWFRTQTPGMPDVAGLFSLLISQSVRFGGWDLIGQGLVDLSLMMLDTQPPLGKMNSKTRAMHNLGAAILAKVIKKHSSSAQIIIPKITNRIIVNAKSQQYTYALMHIIREATTYLLEDGNGVVITNLIENIHRLSYTAGRRTLTALIPLMKINRSLRNPLILVLRKALFSRNIHTRQVGVSGVFTLLKTFKISTNMVSSQLSQSSGSLSQMSIDIHKGGVASNDALCTELLGVLRRCFSLQPSVKIVFYQGMNEVVSKNPELGEGFLELLHLHILELFGVTNTETLPELDLNKTLVEKNGSWSISEPAGWFLHCLQTVVSKAEQIMDAGDSQVLDKLSGFMERLCERYSECEIADLGFDLMDNLDRKTPDGKKRCLKIDILMTMYEAMMEFVMTHGADKVEAKATLLLLLHQNHLTLRNLLNAPKPKKGGKKGDKAKKEEKEDGNETNDGVKEKEKEKGMKRKQDGTDPDEFTMLPHAFSLRSLSVLLHSLLENRTPDTQTALRKLRQSEEFLAYIQTILSALLTRYSSSMAVTGDEGVHSDNIFRYILNITSTLFRHTMMSPEPILEFMQSGLELLVSGLQLLLTQFPTRKLTIINSLTDSNPGKASETDLNPALVPALRLVMKKISRIRDELNDNDTAVKMLPPILSVYSILIQELKEGESAEGPCEWMKKFSEGFTSEDTSLSKHVVKLIFLINLRLQFSGVLCRRTAGQLHCIYGDLDTTREVEASKNMSFLNEESADIILPLLVDHMDQNIEYVDQAITWLKSLASSAPAQVNQPVVELAITEHVAKMVAPSLELVNTALPVGSISDITLKFLIKLYRILGNLANYFFLRARYSRGSVVGSKFDKLLRMVGTQLSPNVYSLITYIQRKFKEQEDEAKAARVRKKKVLDPNLARAKVLRETKEIPNLIFQIETFEKNMAKVGKRINEKFEFKLPTSRDFRIKLTEEHMRELNDEESEEESEDESGDEAEDSRNQTTVSSQDQSQGSVLSVQNRSHSQVSQEPSAKKSKLASKLSKLKENKAMK